MATRIGLLRARGRSRGAQLLHGQQQHLCSSAARGTGNGSSVRFLARLSSSGSDAPVSSLAFSSSSGRQQHQQRRVGPSPFLGGRTNSGSAGSSTQALFSSTSARPSDDGISAGGENRVGTPAPAPMTFDGSSNKDRLASLDDGDKVGAGADGSIDRSICCLMSLRIYGIGVVSSSSVLRVQAGSLVSWVRAATGRQRRYSRGGLLGDGDYGARTICGTSVSFPVHT